MSELWIFLVGMSPVIIIMLCTILVGYCEVVKRHKRKNILSHNRGINVFFDR